MIAALLLAAALPLEPASSAYADEKGVALQSPEGVACTDSGTVIAADSGNGRLVVFAFKEGKFAGGTPVSFPELGRPVRLQIDSHGDVLALDEKNRRIVRVGAGGAFQGFVQIQEMPLGKGFFPVSFKLDAADQIYLLDATSSRVVVLDPSGRFLREFAAPPQSIDVAVDSRGTVYTIDAHGQLSVGGAPLGKPLKEFLNFPGSLTVAPQGVLVIGDKTGHGLVLVSREGAFLGRRLSIGWTEGAIYYPEQVCIDSRGDVFVADRGNHRIQAFTPGK
jgi:DNA-binding beta-propeller fold protein YncE